MCWPSVHPENYHRAISISQLKKACLVWYAVLVVSYCPEIFATFAMYLAESRHRRKDHGYAVRSCDADVDLVVSKFWAENRVGIDFGYMRAVSIVACPSHLWGFPVFCLAE